MDSVAPFLEYASNITSQGLGKKAYDAGLTTLTTIIANFIGSSSTVEVEKVVKSRLDEYASGLDNGIYIVDENWKIVDRIGGPDEEQNVYDRMDMLRAIDEAQSPNYKLGEEFLASRAVELEEIQAGDEILIKDLGGWEKYTVECIGHPEGKDIPYSFHGKGNENLPYIGKYGPDNVNSYVTDYNRPRKLAA